MIKPEAAPGKVPDGSTILLDQSYTTGEPGRVVDPEQTLDLYVPPGIGPFPLVIWIHGGGWTTCDKETDAAPPFLQAGFAFASLNYRLACRGMPFPAQIEDCLAAVHWLRQHGKDYRLDSNSIGFVGHSAGAHLAALVALTGGSNPWSKSVGTPAWIKAAVLWSGPFDLGRERGHWPPSTFIWNPKDPFCQKFFPDEVYEESFAEWASPTSYVRPGVCPLLIVHGEKDDIVPLDQAVAFANALLGAGAELTLRTELESGHDIVSPENYAEAIHFFSGKMNH